MSRSNGPGVPPNGWQAEYSPANPQNPYSNPYPQQPAQTAPPAGRPPRIQNAAPSRSPQPGFPPHGLQQHSAPAYPPQQGQAPQGYGQQQPPPQPQYGQPRPPAYPQQAHAQPPQPQYGQAPQPQYGAPQYAPAAQPSTHRPTQPGYQTDPRDRRPSPYDVLNAPAASPPQPYVPPQQHSQNQYPPTQPPQQQRGGYDQWPQQSPAVDPHGYDLGTYMPAPAQMPDPRTQRPTAPPAWSPPPQPQAYAPDPVQSQSFNAVQQDDADSQADDEHYEDEEGYDEPARRPRFGLIAASVIGAIVAGGGLAYGYKTYYAPPTQMAGTPVVKGGSEPVKVKPADPGGTKFANTDSKVMDSLSGTQPEGADDGPRMVKTLKVERDGSITSPVAAQAPASRVPGMILVGETQAQPEPAPPPAAQQPVAVAPQPPAKPVVVAAAPPPAAEEIPAAVPGPPPAKKVKKPVPPSAVGGPAAAGTSGYVAVLASVPASGSSRLEAMQQFADLQQKFGSVLGSKAPDVVEANLPGKGAYHRLVVGPPASRDAATSVCSQLKAAGYTADCWVTAF